jgi:hypothetical protein
MRYLRILIHKYANENILKRLNLATEQKVEGKADATERTKILFWMRYRNK